MSVTEILGGLVAAACFDHHVAVFLEDNIGAVVIVEHRDGMELCGGATRLGHRVWMNEMNLRRRRVV